MHNENPWLNKLSIKKQRAALLGLCEVYVCEKNDIKYHYLESNSVFRGILQTIAVDSGNWTQHDDMFDITYSYNTQ